MYGAYAGRRTRTHDHGGTVHACNPHGLHCRGVNSISGRQAKYTQKPRAMQMNLHLAASTAAEACFGHVSRHVSRHVSPEGPGGAVPEKCT